jgi:hypothetical protein
MSARQCPAMSAARWGAHRSQRGLCARCCVDDRRRCAAKPTPVSFPEPPAHSFQPSPRIRDLIRPLCFSATSATSPPRPLSTADYTYTYTEYFRTMFASANMACWAFLLATPSDGAKS